MCTTPTRTPRTEYAKPLPGHLVPMASTRCSKATASYPGTSHPWPAPTQAPRTYCERKGSPYPDTSYRICKATARTPRTFCSKAAASYPGTSYPWLTPMPRNHALQARPFLDTASPCPDTPYLLYCKRKASPARTPRTYPLCKHAPALPGQLVPNSEQPNKK